MTFAEILINTMKGKPEAVNFFDYLFYAKQYCMILESIEGESLAQNNFVSWKLVSQMFTIPGS